MQGMRIRLIRAELYEKVWTMPIRTLAEEFNLSDVGLAKICRKHDIPLPPVGYWRQKETGHELTRPPLHIPPRMAAETLDIFVRERLKPEFATLAAEPAPKITIPAELSHALALRTEKLLAHGKENDKKLMVPKEGTTPHLFVSREQLPRALRILNALFLTIEERGQSVSWPKEESAVLTFGVGGETIKFCLLEVINSVAPRPDSRGTEAYLDGPQMGLPIDRQAEASRGQSALWHGAHPKHLVRWKTSATGELHWGFRRWP